MKYQDPKTILSPADFIDRLDVIICAAVSVLHQQHLCENYLQVKNAQKAKKSIY